MEAFPDLASLSDAQLDEMIADLERQEDAMSLRRRLLHGRIDLMRDEYVRRLREHVGEGEEPQVPEAIHLERPLFEGTGVVPADVELEPMPDLDAISDDDLREEIRALEHEEDDVSLQRRVLQGRIDILRAERAARSRTGRGLDMGQLSRVLAANPSKRGDAEA